MEHSLDYSQGIVTDYRLHDFKLFQLVLGRLLRHDAVSIGKYILAFRGNLVVPSS